MIRKIKVTQHHSVMDNLTQLIGERIGLARDSSGYSQEALAKVLGFKDRQTVSSIELGQRKVSPEELVQVARKFVCNYCGT